MNRNKLSWLIASLAFGAPIASPAVAAVQAGVLADNAPVTVKSVRLHGTVADASVRAALEQAGANLVQRTMTKADVDALADQLTEQMHAAGLLVARVLVTPGDRAHFEQTGELQLKVFEGRVGAVRVKNTSRVADARIERTVTKALCLDGLGDGCPLTAKGLERAELLLQDLPGVRLEPVSLSPKEVAVGQTAVGVTTSEASPLTQGYLGIDNYGIAASGLNRLSAGASLTNLFHEGDTLQFLGMVTNGHQTAGSVQGSAPLGYQGLRGQASYSRSLYALSQVQASGSADTVSAGVSYPLFRGLDRNWILALDGVNTESHQSVNGINAFAPRHLKSARVTLSGNAGDRPMQLGGSYWTGSVAWLHGNLRQELDGPDLSGTLGNYDKLSISALGKLNLGNSGWYALGNLRGQIASLNLDASEKLAMGGQSGVRAYRADEGSLDEGLVSSVELRRLFSLQGGSNLSVGAFADYASGRINAHPYPGWQTSNGYADPAMSNYRSLAAWGLGADWVLPRGTTLGVTWANRFGFSRDSINHPGSARDRVLVSLTQRF